MAEKKTSRTFRLEDRMWNHVVAEADNRNVKPTQIVIEAISEHLGRVIRDRNEIDDSQLLQVLKQTEDLKVEIEKIEKSIGKFWFYKYHAINGLMLTH